MALNIAKNRRSAAAVRRLPWLRRFLPAPDGTIDKADRKQLAGVYRGLTPQPKVIRRTVNVFGARAAE
jgi:hypothetical protein